jgi:hypothetical protein
LLPSLAPARPLLRRSALAGLGGVLAAHAGLGSVGLYLSATAVISFLALSTLRRKGV